MHICQKRNCLICWKRRKGMASRIWKDRYGWTEIKKMYGPSGHSWCAGLESTRSIEGRKISAIALQPTPVTQVRQSPRKVCREVVVCSGVCRSCWCTQTVFTASEGVFGEKAGEGKECRRGSGTLEHWWWLLLWEGRMLHESCRGGGGGVQVQISHSGRAQRKSLILLRQEVYHRSITGASTARFDFVVTMFREGKIDEDTVDCPRFVPFKGASREHSSSSFNLG